MKKIVYLLIMLICFNMFAKEDIEKEIPITGAFGFELGKRYRIKTDEQIMFHQLKRVKEPFRKFQKYDISVNKKQEIFLIRAEYTARNIEEAKNETDIIEKILVKKYKKKPTPVKSNNPEIYFTEIKDKNNRSIGIVRENLTIRIMYRDHALGRNQDNNNKENEEKQLEKEVSKSNEDAL